MYGIGPDVANVTANGEQIVSVMELGLCDSCTYRYDNLKNVQISIKNNKVVEIGIYLIDENDNILFAHNYNDLTEEEKEKYLPKAEYRLVTKDAIERYKASHVVYKGHVCSIL